MLNLLHTQVTARSVGPILFSFLMVGLALLMFPHWKNNERLPFPLLTVQLYDIAQQTPEDMRVAQLEKRLIERALARVSSVGISLIPGVLTGL